MDLSGCSAEDRVRLNLAGKDDGFAMARHRKAKDSCGLDGERDGRDCVLLVCFRGLGFDRILRFLYTGTVVVLSISNGPGRGVFRTWSGPGGSSHKGPLASAPPIRDTFLYRAVTARTTWTSSISSSTCSRIRGGYRGLDHRAGAAVGCTRRCFSSCSWRRVLCSFRFAGRFAVVRGGRVLCRRWRVERLGYAHRVLRCRYLGQHVELLDRAVLRRAHHRFRQSEKRSRLNALSKLDHFFAKYGGLTIVITRFMPFFRTFAPFIAGTGHMNFGKFTLFNCIGGIAWISLFVLVGYFFGGIPLVQDHLRSSCWALSPCRWLRLSSAPSRPL